MIGGASELLPLLEDGSLPAMVAAAPPDPLPPQIRQAVEDSRKAGASAGVSNQRMCANVYVWEEREWDGGAGRRKRCCGKLSWLLTRNDR